MIPDLDLARVRKWIDHRNADMPPHVHDQLRYEIHVTDRNLKFHEYDLVDPTPHIDELIDEVERDPTCIFWG